jgi:hypothetical protein
LRPSTPDVVAHNVVAHSTTVATPDPGATGGPTSEAARAFNQLRRDSSHDGHEGMVAQQRVSQRSVFGSQAVMLRPDSAHGRREAGRSDSGSGWAPPAEGTFSLIVPLVLFPGKQVGGQVGSSCHQPTCRDLIVAPRLPADLRRGGEQRGGCCL